MFSHTKLLYSHLTLQFENKFLTNFSTKTLPLGSHVDIFSIYLLLVGCPTRFVLLISANDLLFLKLNSISLSEHWSISQTLCLENQLLHRWSLSSGPPADLVWTTGLCCLLGSLWPQSRSLMINKVETSSPLEGARLVGSSMPLESHVSRTWTRLASENARFADGY